MKSLIVDSLGSSFQPCTIPARKRAGIRRVAESFFGRKEVTPMFNTQQRRNIRRAQRQINIPVSAGEPTEKQQALNEHTIRTCDRGYGGVPCWNRD